MSGSRYMPNCTGQIGGCHPWGQIKANRCPEQPRGDLLAQRNPTCDIRTYKGGLQTCLHGAPPRFISFIAALTFRCCARQAGTCSTPSRRSRGLTSRSFTTRSSASTTPNTNRASTKRSLDRTGASAPGRARLLRRKPAGTTSTRFRSAWRTRTRSRRSARTP